MVLELHIWGPGFDLPSIDAPCLAAIHYLQNCLPIDAWSLVPSSEPSISPLGELPALRNGEIWVAGFGNIVEYLRDVSKGDWDLDGDFDLTQQADCAAFSSFIESRGQPLLDLSFYVSSDNYLGCTRRTLGEILKWPSSWTTPHRIRARAKKRAEHLGLSSLDVDTAQEDGSEDKGLTAHIPKSLRKPKQTVSGLLGRNMQKNRFRLDAVTSDFFEPLLEMLGDKKWFLGERASSVDCLAVGYLALMQTPQLPQGWVKETLETKYTKLDSWVRNQIIGSFGPPVDIAAAGGKGGMKQKQIELPWRASAERNLPQILQSALDGCVSSIPVIGSSYSVSELDNKQSDRQDRYRQKQMRLTRFQHQRDRYVQVVASTCAVTGLLGWLWYKGMLRFPRQARRLPGRQFGEAGALLGLV